MNGNRNKPEWASTPIWEIDPDFINPYNPMPPRNLDEEFPGEWSKPNPIRIYQDLADGTEHEIICEFGGWYVSVFGDLIYTGTTEKRRFYPIWSEQLIKGEK